MTASTTTDRQPRRTPHPLTDEQIAAYHRDGYHIARGLWSADEVAACREAFDALAKRGEPIPFPHDPDHRAWDPEPGSDDPLRRYPRVMHPHFFMDLAMRMMLDRRIEAVLTALIEEQPLATQSMYYFKPPGGKGQALHQDNYYLKVRPKTCIAAWTAIDRSYPENGGLYICPGTHTLEIQCPELANPDESFTTDFVRPPQGIEPVPAVLEPGDVLFFNGCVVHGSRPNTSGGWRRSFICHYMPASATHISDSYAVYDFAGNRIARQRAPGGGPCGKRFGDHGMMARTFAEAAALGLEPVEAGSIPG